MDERRDDRRGPRLAPCRKSRRPGRPRHSRRGPCRLDVGAEAVEHGRLGVEPQLQRAVVDGRQPGIGVRAGEHHRCRSGLGKGGAAGQVGGDRAGGAVVTAWRERCPAPTTLPSTSASDPAVTSWLLKSNVPPVTRIAFLALPRALLLPTTSVPASTMVPPVYVLVPERVRWPSPSLMMLHLLTMAAE